MMSIDDLANDDKPSKKFSNNSSRTNIFSRIDDAIESHYNKKVAKYELDGGSRYDLAEYYLKDAKKYSLLSMIGPLPISFLSGACLMGYNFYNKAYLNKLKNYDYANSNIKNFDLEVYLANTRFLRPVILFSSIFSGVISTAFAALSLTGNLPVEASLYIASGAAGTALGAVSSLKHFEYSYIINANPKAKDKSFKFKENLSKVTERIGSILHRPALNV